MIRVTKPSADPRHVVDTCVSTIRDASLKHRLRAAAEAIVDAADAYDTLASAGLLHEMPRSLPATVNVTQDELEALYTRKLASKSGPGRPIYDSLLIAAPQGKCPLCVQRQAATLDHHLPKSIYPALAVTPINLVPACSDCNKAKLAASPMLPEEVALHPYYDDIDAERWLRGTVIEDSPAAVAFSVAHPSSWSPVLQARVERHFATLDLARLYAAEAADELLNIRHQLALLHASGGDSLVKLELEARALSCRSVRLNGWRTATYEALAASPWFRKGGFSAM